MYFFLIINKNIITIKIRRRRKNLFYTHIILIINNNVIIIIIQCLLSQFLVVEFPNDPLFGIYYYPNSESYIYNRIHRPPQQKQYQHRFL